MLITILLILALICFVVASLPKTSIAGLNLVPLGLAFLTAVFLITNGVL